MKTQEFLKGIPIHFKPTEMKTQSKLTHTYNTYTPQPSTPIKHAGSKHQMNMIHLPYSTKHHILNNKPNLYTSLNLILEIDTLAIHQLKS